ncbi:hypothetical protein D3C73_1442790 [compost metagenome]
MNDVRSRQVACRSNYCFSDGAASLPFSDLYAFFNNAFTASFMNGTIHATAT